MTRKLKRLVAIALAAATVGMLIGLPLMTIGNIALALGIVIGAKLRES